MSGSSCGAQVYAYSVKLYNCGAVSTAPSRAAADQSCARSDSAWPACLAQVDAVTACLQTDCSTWESSCATEINELTACLSPTEGGGNGGGSGGGWGTGQTCGDGANVLYECCALAGGSCDTPAQYAACCGNRSCSSGQGIACLADYTPASVDACLNAFKACGLQ